MIARARPPVAERAALCGAVLLLAAAWAGTLGGGPTRGPQTGQSAGLRLDPNVASRAELTLLPEVGPACADALIAARGTPFRSLADVDRVRGIGPARIQKLAPYLRFPPPAPEHP